jgi:hypothetical protein
VYGDGSGFGAFFYALVGRNFADIGFDVFRSVGMGVFCLGRCIALENGHS